MIIWAKITLLFNFGIINIIRYSMEISYKNWIICGYIHIYIYMVVVVSPSVMSNCFLTPRSVAHQAPLSMGFPSHEYWSGLPFPNPVDLLNPEIESATPTWQVDSLPWCQQGNPSIYLCVCVCLCVCA